MILRIDSREQKPLRFKHEWITGREVVALPFGDYGCRFKDGHEVPIIFERKVAGELFGSFTSGYKKERKKLQKSIDKKYKYIIVVEGVFGEVVGGFKYSSVKGQSIVRTMMTWEHKYNVNVHYFKSRDEMAYYIAEYFYAYAKLYLEK